MATKALDQMSTEELTQYLKEQKRKERQLPKEAWITLDPGELSSSEAAKWKLYKDAYEVAKTERESFEEEISKRARAGQTIRFGYNFGKLTVAVLNADGSPAVMKPEGKAPKEGYDIDDILPPPKLKTVSGG